jgi:O-antigen/teichoic acid export membrane protein
VLKHPLARLLRTLPDGTLGTTVALLARVVIQAFTFILISRELGAGGYGGFVGVVAISVLVAPLSSLGFEFMMLRAIALDQASAARAVGTGIAVVAVVGPVVCLSAWAVCALMLPGIPWLVILPVVVADALLGPFVDVCWRAFQGADMMRRAATIRVVPAVARCGAAVICVWQPGTASAANWAMLYLAGSLSAAMFVITITRARFGTLAVDMSLFRRRLGDSWHFSANVATERVTNDADKFLLASLGGASAAGIYGAAYRIVEIFSVPIAAVVLSANAGAFRAGGIGGIGGVLRRLLIVVGLYGVMAAAILHAGAGLVQILLGPGFAASSHVVAALSLLPLLYGIRSTLWLALAATGRHRLRTSAQCVVAVVNVVANIMLIPGLGWVGAVCATLGSEAILAGIFAWGLRFSRAPAPPGAPASGQDAR